MESLSTWGYSGNGYVNQEGHRFMFVGFTDASGTVYMFEAVETPGYYVAGALTGEGSITTSAIVEAVSTGRIETLACFSDHALSMMSNEGYRDDNDVLWTATAEEVAAVEAHREAKYQEWLISNPVAELESYVESDVISEVVVRVFGGSSHPARVEVAHDYLEDFTAYQSNPVVIDSYETAAKTTESGAAYVQFRFFAS